MNRLLAALAALALATGVARATPPTVLTYSGFLMDSAGTTPLTGVHDFNFRFYTLATGGTQIGSGDITVSTTVGSDGFFSVVIDVSSIANNPLFRSQMFMSVRVDADVNPMTPRVQVTSAPGALSVPYGGITDFPTTQCGAGQFATGFDVNGNVVCASAQGGVTSVNAGTGVAVSATTGAVTVSANLAPAGGDGGASTAIARADHAHDARYVQPGALSAIGTPNAPGNPVDWSQLKNIPAPIADGADAVGLTAVAVGSGLSGDGSSGSPILLPACATAGYALKWSGSAYTCAADVDTNTTYGAGAGLALSGTTFSIASGGVAPAMLSAGAVGTAALADSAVTAAKLAPSAVTSVAIADGAVTFAKLNQNGCAANQFPRWNGTSWACSTPLNDTGCAPGQVLKWNGTEFNCQLDIDTSTNYLPGAGLTLSGSTFSVTSLGVTTAMLADAAVTLGKLSGIGCAEGEAPVYTAVGFTCQGVVTSFSATPPLTVSTSASGPVLGLPFATNLDSGYVTSVDFVRFNAALQAVNAAAPLTGDGGAFAPLTLSPCGPGQILRTDSGGAGWVCDNETPGTVTQITTGAGLTGGPITSSGTISIAAKGVTPAMIENGAGGQVLMTNASNNAAWLGISGDATLGSGGVLTLGTSGVAAGTYNNSSTTHTPFTVDAKGRVTSTGAAITIAPAFSSITGKPTTLAGYGVTDAVVTGAVTGASVTATTGNVTTAGQFAYSAARTYTKYIGAIGFQHMNSSGGSFGATYWYNSSASTATLYFHADPAAYIPNGASIVSIRCDRYDAHDTANHSGSVYMWRRSITSTTLGSLGSASCAATTGTAAAPELNTSCLLTFGAPIVMDYSNYQYHIGIDNFSMPAASTAIRFYGCLVTYTATGVNP